MMTSKRRKERIRILKYKLENITNFALRIKQQKKTVLNRGATIKLNALLNECRESINQLNSAIRNHKRKLFMQIFKVQMIGHKILKTHKNTFEALAKNDTDMSEDDINNFMDEHKDVMDDLAK